MLNPIFKKEKFKKSVREEVKNLFRTTQMCIRDREKELAINNYLCENGTYDYDALDNAEQYGYQRVDPEYNDAFTPYGILIDGKGVCASYAGSFKLLADAAGLKSIVTLSLIHI